MDGYTFAIEPATQYTCAFDNKWEPADKLPVSDCSGKLSICLFQKQFYASGEIAHSVELSNLN